MSTLPTIDLKTASDEAINAAVAEHCAGWTNVLLDSKKAKIYRGNQIGTVHRLQVADYLHKANAVIELLEKTGYDAIDLFREMHSNKMQWGCQLYDWDAEGEDTASAKPPVHGTADSFTRAACIALLKASGKIEVIE